MKKPTKYKPLTDRSRAFAAEYIIDFNATQAAVRAGYKETAARKYASEMLQNQLVQEEVARLMSERSKRTEITADRVLREVARVGLSDIRRLFNEHGALKQINELDDDIAAAVASVEVYEEFGGNGKDRVILGHLRKVKLWDKNPAIDKLMKHLGMYEKDNAQITDPLVELLKGLSGKVVSPVMGPGESANDEDGDDD